MKSLTLRPHSRTAGSEDLGQDLQMFTSPKAIPRVLIQPDHTLDPWKSKTLSSSIAIYHGVEDSAVRMKNRSNRGKFSHDWQWHSGSPPCSRILQALQDLPHVPR